jgi:hypothetical protein
VSPYPANAIHAVIDHGSHWYVVRIETKIHKFAKRISSANTTGYAGFVA